LTVTSNSPTKSPQISVVIVSWNALKYLDECLDSLSRGIVRPYEVLVVDNASSDGSPEMVERNYPWVILIRSATNLGFSKANNIGIKQCRGTYIALINSDVNVFPSCLDNLADFLDQNPSVGLVGPRVMYGDRKQQSSCRHFPSLWNNFCEVFYLNRLFPRSRFFSGEHMFYFPYDRTIEVEVLVGCFIMARRRALDDFGLLDENFFFYGEDLDWSRRCRQAGWKVMFYPGAECIHYCGGSSANDPVRFSVAQLKARVQLWAKYRSKAAQVGLIVLLIAQCSFRMGGAIFKLLLPGTDREKARHRAGQQLTGLRALVAHLFTPQ
jgi:GT2 family glycosyltransferase